LVPKKGAVKVNDLLVIRREEGLDGRIRETAEEDLVLTLFCAERRNRKNFKVNTFRDFKSQCKDFRTGVILENFEVLVMARAAEFRID
jgi:hypothetical protein